MYLFHRSYHILLCIILEYLVILYIQYYYYYSHIFPDSRAQHCNYATLLAGRVQY